MQGNRFSKEDGIHGMRGERQMTSGETGVPYTYAEHTGLGLVGHSNRKSSVRVIFLVLLAVVVAAGIAVWLYADQLF